jgi:predicted RND superfamily exporter protein
MTIAAVFLSQKNTIDTNVQNYFNKTTDLRKANEFFVKEIGGVNAIEMIIDSEEADGILGLNFMTRLDSFLSRVRKLEGVTKVHSVLGQIKEVNRVMSGGDEKYFTVPSSREKAAQELFFLDMSLPPSKSIYRSISSDRSKVRVTVFWTRTSSLSIVDGRSKIEQLFLNHQLKGHVTGGVPLNAALDGYIITSFVKSMSVAIILISILMMVVFKSVWFGLFSMIPNIIVPSFGAAILYIIGRQFDAASILIFSICLGIAIDDTIYFLTNLKRSMDEKLTIEATVGRVLEQAGATLSYTTIILVSVFGLFYLGSFVPNENFAIATTVILTSALALDLVFLPALILFIENSKFIPFSFSD